MIQKLMTYDQLYYLGVIPQNNDLYHHGILGMKWGVRHDHYPLSASEHTAAEKKSGWKKSLESGANGRIERGRVARKATKELNNLDKEIGKATYKKEKLDRKKRRVDFWQGKKAAVKKSYKKRLDKIDNLDKKINDGNALKNDLIKKLNSQGYGVRSKNYSRNANELKATAQFLLGYKATGGDLLVGRAGYWYNDSRQIGTKYKVDSNKNKPRGRIRTNSGIGRNIATAVVATAASKALPKIAKNYSSRRQAENMHYQNLARKGLLIEQEVVKKAKYRQVS